MCAASMHFKHSNYAQLHKWVTDDVANIIIIGLVCVVIKQLMHNKF